MKKIKWTKNGDNYIFSFVGNIYMRCFRGNFHNASMWNSEVSLDELNMMMRRGPMRKSLSKAKEDAVRLARELLLDGYAALVNEMKNFDLLEEIYDG
jgi:hypothetical protein